jgi:hypothetical protein
MSEAVRDAKLRLVLDTVEAVRGMEDVARAGAKVEDQENRIAESISKVEEAARRSATAQAAQKQIDRYGGTELSKVETRKSRRYQGFVERFEAEQEMMQYDDRKRRQEEARKTFEKAAAEHQSRAAAEYKNNAREHLHRLGLVDARGDYEKARDAERGSGGLSGMMGMMGRFGPHAFLATGAAMAASRAVSFTTNTANTLQNNDLTLAQKGHAILDDATLGVSKQLRELGNALDGTTERVRRAGIRLQEQSQVNSLAGRNWDEYAAARNTALTAGVAADVLGSSSVRRWDHIDRGTYGGQVAFGQQQQRIAADDSLAAAERQAEIARGALGVQRAVVDEARDDYRIAHAARQRVNRLYNDTLRDEAGGSRRQASRAELGTELRLAQEEEGRALERLIESRRRLGQVGVEAAQAEARAREATVEVMRTELTIAEQRTNRMSSDAARIGGLSAVDRSLAASAAIMAQEQGIGSLTQRMRARVQAIAPEWYQAQVQRLGEGTAEFGELSRRGILQHDGRRSIEESRREETVLRDSVRQEVLRNQQVLARETSEILDRALRSLVSSFDQRVRDLVRELTTGRQMSNNAL